MLVSNKPVGEAKTAKTCRNTVQLSSPAPGGLLSCRTVQKAPVLIKHAWIS